MKKLLVIFTFLLVGCGMDIQVAKPVVENPETLPEVPPKTAEQLLEEAITILKAQSLEAEIPFTAMIDSFVNADPEDIIEEEDGSFSLSMNQGGDTDEYIQTEINLGEKETFSLNIWFKTDDPTLVQTLFWQGVGNQNGWGGGDNVNRSEFNLNINHWSDTTGQILGTFYGYNEGADNSEGSGELLAAMFPVTRDPGDGSFVLTGQTVPIGVEWNHLVATVHHRPGEVEIEVYFNGEFVQSGVGTQVDISMWDTLFRIGRPGTNTRKFSGKLSNFMVFDKVLTDKDVENLYLYGRK